MYVLCVYVHELIFNYLSMILEYCLHTHTYSYQIKLAKCKMNGLLSLGI